MSTEADPIVGNWYQHLDKGQRFKVLAVDEDEGSVDIQHFDGDLEEMDLSDWYQADLEPGEAPENWAGPIDVGEPDDLGSSITDTAAADWDAPLEENERNRGRRELSESEDQEDDWGEGRLVEELYTDNR